ncbi:S41 family peptidase [Gaoshiqia sp. Z1-71]|uniref:S41 family peptidase n=1 Tax=Gaoshiqia hydrogeniformans TaxID=3290090 RepID=UPI003BF8B3BA
MSSRIKLTGISLIFIFGLFAFSPAVQAQDMQANMMKFGRLLRLIESYYVDTTDINKLTEVAINEVLEKLDPHSVYISKEEVEKMNEPLKGSFEGIGISFNIMKDTLLVVSIIPGGPSEKVGLFPGDRILVVDGKTIAGVGLKNSDVMDMLRGDKGTKVSLKVQRKSSADLLDFTIIRDKIPINSLDASYMINDATGYIKLNRFSATTSDEFLSAIKDLKKTPGFKNLVLDLRGNGGGYLTAAIELADHFLMASRLVVYTEGVHDKRKEYRSTALGEFEQGKLIVLIDEGSASASEIVAGAVQDWDRGIIIGRRSFGKGLVQQPFPLNDGSMIRLTTAHYYTPSGRGIQKPYQNGLEEYRKDYLTRFENGELFSEDSIHFDQTQVYETLKSKRIVYGGGGVMPDIFVPMDTSANYVYYNQLVRRNILNTVVLNYLDANRDKLTKQYPEFSSFKDKFVVTDDLITVIVAEADKEKVEKNTESLEFARPIIKKQAKAILARSLYGSGYYYQIINQDEKIIQKALEVLKNNAEYDKLLVEK